MIEVKMERNGSKFRFSAKGHAGSGEKGHDIVCASVSILAYTLCQNVYDMQMQNLVMPNPTLKLKSGIGRIMCEAANEDNESLVYDLFLVISRGFALLEKNYPQYVRFTDKM